MPITKDQQRIKELEQKIIQLEETKHTLQENEAKYRLITENLQDVVWRMDLETVFTYVSSSVEKIFGYKVEEVVGKPIKEIFTPESYEQAMAAFLGRVHSDDPTVRRIAVEYDCVKKDGTVFPVEISSAIECDENGKPIAVVGVTRDISNRKQAEAMIRIRAQELAALNAVSTQISRSLFLEPVISEAVRGVLEATQASATFLLMRDGEDLIPVEIAFSDPSRKFDDFPTHKLGACLCGMAVSERKAIYSADIYNDTRCTWDECKEAGLKSTTALPLFRGDEIFAVLGLGADSERDFEAQAEFLETLSSEVANGLQNALLYEAESKRRLEAESLRRATVAMTASLDLQQVLEGILDGLATVVPYDSVSVFMFEEDGQRIVAGRGYTNPDKLMGQIFPRNDAFTPEIVETRQPQIFADANEFPRFGDWGGVDYIRGWMVIPLVVRDEVIGRLSVDSRTPNAFDNTHAELALAFANQAAIAIDNARMFKETQEHADQLEERVEERTAELRQMINFMAGREVRMADLKKVIEKLRAQIKVAGMTPVADDPLLEDL